MYRGGTRACFHRLDFQSKNVSYAIFYCQKKAFVCEFQHTPLWKLMISQGSTPHVGMRFCGHVPNSPRNKNLKMLILNLLKIVVCWIPKDCCPPFAGAKLLFFFNFECYDLTNGKK
jgi:hypothetical protein